LQKQERRLLRVQERELEPAPFSGPLWVEDRRQLRRRERGLLRSRERRMAREKERGPLRTKDSGQVRVLLQLEEPGPERRPFRDRERAQEPSLERGEDRPLLRTLEPDLLNGRHRVLLRGEASLQWGCHSRRIPNNPLPMTKLGGRISKRA